MNSQKVSEIFAVLLAILVLCHKFSTQLNSSLLKMAARMIRDTGE